MTAAPRVHLIKRKAFSVILTACGRLASSTIYCAERDHTLRIFVGDPAEPGFIRQIEATEDAGKVTCGVCKRKVKR